MSVLFHLARHRMSIAVVVVSGVLVIAGCGSSSTSSSTSKSPSSSFESFELRAIPARGRALHTYPRGAGLPGSDLRRWRRSGQPPNPSGYADLAGVRGGPAAVRKARPGARGLCRGVQETPSGDAMAQMLAVAECMRAHGVPNFPDPARTYPANPARYSSVAKMNGVVWAIPKSIELQAPAVKQAASACGSTAAAVIAP